MWKLKDRENKPKNQNSTCYYTKYIVHTTCLWWQAIHLTWHNMDRLRYLRNIVYKTHVYFIWIISFCLLSVQWRAKQWGRHVFCFRMTAICDGIKAICPVASFYTGLLRLMTKRMKNNNKMAMEEYDIRCVFFWWKRKSFTSSPL